MSNIETDDDYDEQAELIKYFELDDATVPHSYLSNAFKEFLHSPIISALPFSVFKGKAIVALKEVSEYLGICMDKEFLNNKAFVTLVKMEVDKIIFGASDDKEIWNATKDIVLKYIDNRRFEIDEELRGLYRREVDLTSNAFYVGLPAHIKDVDRELTINHAKRIALIAKQIDDPDNADFYKRQGDALDAYSKSLYKLSDLVGNEPSGEEND